MATIRPHNILVSIDIGTTKICTLVAQQLGTDQLEIIGIGQSPSYGLRKGIVVNMGQTIHSIKRAVKEAEIMAGITIESAYIGISGGHIHSISSQGIVPIKRGVVRKSDVSNAIVAARAIPIPEGQQVLHVLPQYFIIDSAEKIYDPVGLHGVRLEVQAHIIMGSITSVQNLVNCCEMAGITVKDIILEQLASAQAVLSKDERTLGVAMIDIGGGTADVALYQQESIRHTMVLPVAGNHFTNDIAIGLCTPLKEAEEIKRTYGLASKELLENDDLIEIEMIQGNKMRIIKRSDLVRIIEPRAQELLSLIYDKLVMHNLLDMMTTGVVLTGGGSLLKGMDSLAQRIFSMPVRIGMPRIAHDIPGSLENPIYATGYGLLLQALKKGCSNINIEGPLLKRIIMSMKSWVSDFF
ncbi:cell division protein FtsA [Candidatus Dependentiae bacterium]|nr:MAG: cell division protein FtsA [Candidatus Dependentiae bacterium]